MGHFFTKKILCICPNHIFEAKNEKLRKDLVRRRPTELLQLISSIIHPSFIHQLVKNHK
jgi:hypothetical protein